MSSMKFVEIYIIGLVFLTIISFSLLPNNSKGLLDVYFFDVGQGDSIFIETVDGKQILVDGGPNNYVIQKLGKVMPFNDRSIDILIISHTDKDHITGLVEVLERYDVDLIIRSNILCETSLCIALEKKITKEGAPIWLVDAGDYIDLGHGSYLKILYPFDNEIYNGKPNDNSVVIKLIAGEDSLLLTGDIEKKIENKLLYSKSDISADYLKLAHHGSKTSTSEVFLDAVSPAAVFIEVGDNYYGHPSEQVLARLEERGIKYYRTDKDGDTHLIMGQENIIEINSL